MTPLFYVSNHVHLETPQNINLVSRDLHIFCSTADFHPGRQWIRGRRVCTAFAPVALPDMKSVIFHLWSTSGSTQQPGGTRWTSFSGGAKGWHQTAFSWFVINNLGGGFKYVLFSPIGEDEPILPFFSIGLKPPPRWPFHEKMMCQTTSTYIPSEWLNFKSLNGMSADLLNMKKYFEGSLLSREN